MSTVHRVASQGQVAPGGALRIVAGGHDIALYNVDGSFYATADECSHAEASLSDGWLEGDEITCPLHGACFNVKTGQALTLPATRPVRTYQVRIENDDIYIEI